MARFEEAQGAEGGGAFVGSVPLRQREVNLSGVKSAENFEFGGSEGVKTGEEDAVPWRRGGAKPLGGEFEALWAEEETGLTESGFEKDNQLVEGAGGGGVTGVRGPGGLADLLDEVDEHAEKAFGVGERSKEGGRVGV